MLAGFAVFIGIFTGEYLFKGYSIRNNAISDLGQRIDPVNSSRSSSIIFNSAMIIAGTAILLSGVLLHSKLDNSFVTIPLMLHGIGTAGVGIFPSTIKPTHFIFALTTFITVEFASIATYWLVNDVMKYLLASLGVTSFIFLIGNFLFVKALGVGGAERFIVYPTTLWLIIFGGYLLINKSV